jgi:uncharacterized protein YceH (UPF0502 family)
MVDFDSLEEVEHELRFLSNVEEPLATSLGRKPGQKEERWICPLVAHSPRQHAPDGPAAGVSSVAREEDQHTRAVDLGPVAGDRLDDLRSELVDLRSEIAELRRDMDELRESLGG